MKKILLAVIVLFAAASMSVSCNAIEKLTYTDIELDDFSIDLTAVVGTQPVGAMDNFPVPTRSSSNTFTATYTFSIDEVQDFQDFAKYKSFIRSIQIGEATLGCTTTGAGTNVTNLVMEANLGTRSSWVVDFEKDLYTFGGTPMNVTDFAQQMMNAFIKGNNITLTLSGYTDAPNGQNIDAELLLKQVVINAGMNL